MSVYRLARKSCKCHHYPKIRYFDYLLALQKLNTTFLAAVTAVINMHPELLQESRL